MNRSVSVGIIVFVVAFAAAVGAPTTMAAGTPTAEGDSPHTQQSTTDPRIQLQSSTNSIANTQDFDQTTFEITVHENGSATWTFQHQRRFDSENESEEREAFQTFAEEFESEETDLYQRFTTLVDSLVETGMDRTDREMEATNFRRSARVEEQLGTSRGIVEMSFTWEGIAEVDGNTVTVGDVFEGIYLAEDQAIEISAGDGLTFERVEPTGEARYTGESVKSTNEVVWRGEHQFLDGQPQAVLVTEASDSASWPFAAGGLLLLVIAVGAVWYGRRWWPDAGADEGSEPETPAQTEDATAETAAAGTAAAAAGTDDRTEAAAASEPLTDDELLTDEDRVVKLIRENGGRMKQVNIVEETGWSKSKVSMLLSDMEEDGTISKLRVGRENIISLDGFEPEATKSPFEE
ncbi:helix-turn-helix transcriptional regulator [Haloterrigena alkaliphila]|uniref:IclR helix-turn-helix domain-containing protein n=1 Tax=Haloterrigena alkaliphila TaxID=2816475 RepID=A0A8A2VDT7_9EURY|nr:hypothetical protein [Haloterrigena alkaliphila]QSW99406.1 hypothetical protein J0X25_00155 [Haloterrigena alkaliphila]